MVIASSTPIEPVLDASPVPLVIGVVGHRDPLPGALPRLRRAVRRDLEALISALPHTPLLMLNGLAEGMDHEVAEVFLEVIAADRQRRPDGPRHQLLAVLPLRVETYRLKFNDSGARQRFEALLQRCDAVLDPEVCAELGNAGMDLPEPECYAQQGIVLVRNAYLMLACHNGYETMAIGGAAQAVAMQKGLVHPLFLDVDEVIAAREPGALIEYDTPRRSTKLLSPLPPRRCWVEAEEASWQQLLLLPLQIEAINQAMSEKAWSPLSWAPRRTVLWHLVDDIANRSKREFHTVLLLVLLVGWLITVSLSQQAFQLVGMALILAALALFPRMQTSPKHRFIVHRCLAESLTVQEFWADQEVHCDAADLFDSQTHSQLAWIRTVLRARRLQLLQRGPRSPDALEAAAAEALRWMRGQVDWLQVAISRQQRISRWLAWGALLLFAAAVLLSLLTLALPAFARGLSVSLDICLASFALLLACRELLGYEETNARYRRSRDQFSRGLRAFEQAYLTPTADEQRLRRLRCALEAVGREKIDELNDWVSDQLKRIYRPGS